MCLECSEVDTVSSSSFKQSRSHKGSLTVQFQSHVSEKNRKQQHILGFLSEAGRHSFRHQQRYLTIQDMLLTDFCFEMTKPKLRKNLFSPLPF